MLNTTTLHLIKQHALYESPNECCGFVVIDYSLNDKVIKCRNAADDKQNRFKISPKDYLYASRQGHINYLYHSQKSLDKFSFWDKTTHDTHRIKGVLYVVDLDKFIYYNPKNKYDQYLGIPFENGKNDCISIVLLYYKEELGLEIKHPFESSLPLKRNLLTSKTEEISKMEYEKQAFSDGLIKINDINNIKQHDILIFKGVGYKHNSHIAVYIGDNKILHNLENSYSKIDELTLEYKKKISAVFRHRSL